MHKRLTFPFYRFILGHRFCRVSAGFMRDTAERELSRRKGLAYFFLGAFLLQGFELPVLVFVDEYPASLNVRHCLVKQKQNLTRRTKKRQLFTFTLADEKPLKSYQERSQ